MSQDADISTEEIVRVLQSLLELLDADAIERRAGQIARTTAPLRILRGLEKLRETTSDVLTTPEELDVFITLSDQGTYPQQQLVAHPADIEAIAKGRSISSEIDDLRDSLRQQLGEDPTETALLETLRGFKRRESLRIFLREIDGVASVRQTTAEIAAIAEVCLEVAVEHSARLLGDPTLAEQFCVLGMGKLGGRELNFSSDIDLIYVCADDLDAEQQQLVDTLGRKVTAALDRNTAAGYVFRVDLRLRPQGTQGALVQGVGPVAEYYTNWGRTWERSALIKARPVAGNQKLGEKLLSGLESLIFRRYLDFEAIDELRSMKEKINKEAQLSSIIGIREEATPDAPEKPETPLKKRLKNKLRGSSRRRRRPSIKPSSPEPSVDVSHEDTSGVLAWDVKLGVGGIREIEFFVQALQLVHCGTRPTLRTRSTLEALDRLLYAGLINHDDHARLADAYAFFRRVEHRVQMEHDRQGHQLPKNPTDFENLARRMGVEPDSLRETVIGHREDVRQMFSRLFEDSDQSEKAPTVHDAGPGALDTVLGAPIDSLESQAVKSSLESLGFSRPLQVAGQLSILKEKPYGPFSARASSDQQQFARYLLENCGAAPNSDQAFSFLTRFITLVGDRPGYHRMLQDNPHASRLLIHVFGSSQYLAGALLKEPAIFERLLGAGTVAVIRSFEDMIAELQRRLDFASDPEHRIGVIRRFHQEETLRIGLHETGGAATTNQTHHQLSLLAEVVIRAVALEVYQPLRTRRRRPGSVLPPLTEIPFAIIAMGKLGGRELGFASDLDLVFIYEEERQWRLEHSFFARLAQRIVRTLSSAGIEGKMYEVDTRLRPSGQQGALVVSLEAFEEYHREKAELWERQALIRGRGILGPEELLASYEDARVRFAFERELPADAGVQIREMVERLRESQLEHQSLDVKFTPGAMLDIEFITQYLQLRFAAGVARTRHKASSPSTDEALIGLASLEEVGRELPEVQLDQLRTDYEVLRGVEARLRMADHRGDTRLPSSPEDLGILARRLGYQGADAANSMLAELAQLTARTLETWDNIQS